MKARLMGAVCTGLFSFGLVSVAHAAGVSGQGTWETTLQGRDLDGNAATYEAYYDTTLDITWLADANAAVGSIYDTHIPGTGLMEWALADTWASNLNVNGITGWRLPTLGPIWGPTFDYTFNFDGTADRGYNISAPGTAYAGRTASEMAHLFYNTLGNLAYYDTSGTGPQPGWGLTNTGPFSNFQSDDYWSGVKSFDGWWDFAFNYGIQNSVSGTYSYALAVRDGDVSAVPVPAAIWLFGSGLIGLAGMARRKAA